VGGQHFGTGVKLGQQPAHTLPLGYRQLVSTLGAEEVRTTYRARQYRPAGADVEVDKYHDYGHTYVTPRRGKSAR
jgi:hypothetical protein